MSTTNPNDDDLRELLRQFRELTQANPGRSTAIERGMTEYYDQSTLRITDSNLEVIGEAIITGWLRVIGRIVLEGLGILDVNGLINLAGAMRVLTGGGITVEDGGDIVVNGGEIRVGNVVLKDGKLVVGVAGAEIVIDGATGTITVGTGIAKVTIDGATGEIHAGAMTLDPTADGGALLFDNGSKLFSNLLAIGLQNGNAALTLGALASALRYGDNYVSAGPNGINMAGIREVTSADGVKWVGILDSGELVKVAPGIGGPGASITWPFPPSTVTSEYGPREVTIPGASPFHLGIDFGMPGGTPIPAAGAGRVTFAGESGGYGNHVEINHGGGLVTTYSHMQTAPYVSVGQYVARGFELGPVGDTGTSGGNHLHFEVHVNGEPVNPRSKLPAA